MLQQRLLQARPHEDRGWFILGVDEPYRLLSPHSIVRIDEPYYLLLPQSMRLRMGHYNSAYHSRR